MKHLDAALAELDSYNLEEYEELIELWAWYGGCG
jgi:hypothetical protein